jgi:4-hydroxy-tetrahydrodipicolinate reductase
VKRGQILGVKHAVDARDEAGRVVASARLEMRFGHDDPGDEIRITGDPPLHLRFEGGIPGDRATVGSVLTGLRWAPGATPGLG